MATALASLFSQKPVRPDVGMTGEITLRGKVLPIGGDKDFGALVEHSGQLAENPTSASSPRPGQRALGITSSLGEFP